MEASRGRNDTFKKVNVSNEDTARHLISLFVGNDEKDTTEKNIQYYLNFSDPLIPEQQMASMLVAIIAANLWSMKAEGISGASAVTAFDWMRERALESPQTMNIFRFYCENQMVMNFKYSARNKDWERYLAGVRLSQPIQAVTHGIIYTRMGFDLLRDASVCWSEMEKFIVKDRLFVVKSEKGDWIEMDYCQEKHVRQIRDYTGHVARRGHEVKIEEAAAAGISQATNQHTKHAIKKLGHEQDSKLETTKTFPDFTQHPRAVKAFARTFLLLVQGRFFMKGLSNNETNDTTLTSMADGKPLDSRQLDCCLIGEGKVGKYGTRFYIEREHEVVRKNKDIDMDRIPSSSQIVSDKIERVRLRRTSLDVNEVEKNGTKEELYAEFATMEPHLSRRQRQKIPKLTPAQLKGTNKKVLTKILVGLQDPLFKRKPEIRTILTDTARKEVGDSSTSIERRRKTLDHEVYSQSRCSARDEAMFNAITAFP